ncbi:MAG: hypothetical protein F4X02_10390 [Chloroflexi bacterium]|nr:hypothetical protein [Chloroflexota bacterium]
MSALGFSEADLEANRRGELSPSQTARLRASRRRQLAAGLLLFASLVIAATIFIYLGQASGNAILGWAGALLILINAVVVGVMARGYMRVGGDLRPGNVEVLAGEVERVLRRGRQADNYLIRIDGASLAVSKEVFLSFRHEAPYRIYRSVHACLLLSAEAID